METEFIFDKIIRNKIKKDYTLVQNENLVYTSLDIKHRVCYDSFGKEELYINTRIITESRFWKDTSIW
jgi:hypothetical protein